MNEYMAMGSGGYMCTNSLCSNGIVAEYFPGKLNLCLVDLQFTQQYEWLL